MHRCTSAPFLAGGSQGALVCGRSSGAIPRSHAAVGPTPESVFAAARHPNIAVKASALLSDVNEPYPFPRPQQYSRRLRDACGTQHVFWGTDLTRLSGPYRQAVAPLTEERDFLSDEDPEWIMGYSIAEWLDCPLPRN